MKKSIGIDIGGTKVAIALVNENGTFEHRLDIKSDTSSAEKLYEGIVSGVEEVLNSAKCQIKELQGIGIGLPGKVDVKNGVAVYQNNIPWTNFPIVERIRQTFNINHVKIDNDVKVAAYAEYRLANLQPDDMFGYLTISTGIACANIVNDTIIRGTGFSGEIGFLPVPTSNGLLPIEKVAAGPGIANYAQLLYQTNKMSTKEVFERYQLGESKAIAAVEQSITSVAIALYSMICLLDPRLIVLGGSVAMNNSTYVDNIILKLAELVHEEQRHILKNIRVSQLEGHNGIIGAGLLVID